MAETTRMRAPQRGQRSASTSKTRWRSSAHGSLRRWVARWASRARRAAHGSLADVGARVAESKSPEPVSLVWLLAFWPPWAISSGSRLAAKIGSAAWGPAGSGAGRGPGTMRARALAQGASTPW